MAPFKKMNIDQAEMACLKTIILFDAGKQTKIGSN